MNLALVWVGYFSFWFGSNNSLKNLIKFQVEFECLGMNRDM